MVHHNMQRTIEWSTLTSSSRAHLAPARRLRRYSLTAQTVDAVQGSLALLSAAARAELAKVSSAAAASERGVRQGRGVTIKWCTIIYSVPLNGPPLYTAHH